MYCEEESLQLADCTFKIGEVQVNPLLGEVTSADGEVTLVSRRQILAIIELAENYGEVVSRAEIHKILCLTEEGMRDKGALSHHIGLIRKAFGDSAKNPKYIKTIRGRGYCLLERPTAIASSAFDYKELSQNTSLSGLEVPANRSFGSPIWNIGTAVVVVVMISLVLSQSTFQLLSQHDSFLANGVSTAQAQNNVSEIDRARINTARSADEIKVDRSNPAINSLMQTYQDLLKDNDISLQDKAEQLSMVGQRLIRFKEWAASEQALQDSLSIWRRNQGDFSDVAQVAMTLTKLAQVQSRVAQNIDDSRGLLVEAASLMRSQNPMSVDFADMLYIHAQLLNFGADASGAESLLREALNIIDDRSQDHHRLFISLNVSLAKMLTLQSKFVEAEQLTTELLSSETARLSRDDISLVPIIGQYGFLLASMEKYAESAKQYQRVLDIQAYYYSNDHPRTLHGKFNLADSLLQAGEIDQAVAYYSELIQLDIQRNQSESLRLSNLKLRLSSALLEAKEPARAYQEIQQAISMIENLGEVPSWLRYSASSLHGAALIELGECAKGMRLINQTVEQIFLDAYTEPRTTSKIYARKTYYERSAQCSPRELA